MKRILAPLFILLLLVLTPLTPESLGASEVSETAPPSSTAEASGTAEELLADVWGLTPLREVSWPTLHRLESFENLNGEDVYPIAQVEWDSEGAIRYDRTWVRYSSPEELLSVTIHEQTHVAIFMADARIPENLLILEEDREWAGRTFDTYEAPEYRALEAIADCVASTVNGGAGYTYYLTAPCPEEYLSGSMEFLEEITGESWEGIRNERPSLRDFFLR